MVELTNIYQKSTNYQIDDGLLDDIGDVFVSKDQNGLFDSYGILLEESVFELYTFEQFFHYVKWMMEKRGIETSKRKKRN